VHRPTLHLTNLSSSRQHGPGRLLSAMARPPRHVVDAVQGFVFEAGPAADDNRWIIGLKREGKLTDEDVGFYRDFTKARFEVIARDDGYLPELLGYAAETNLRTKVGPVEGGDTLVCTCPRKDSPRRTHECHLEWLAPFLVEAGWRVVLYGEEFANEQGGARCAS